MQETGPEGLPQGQSAGIEVNWFKSLQIAGGSHPDPGSDLIQERPGLYESGQASRARVPKAASLGKIFSQCTNLGSKLTIRLILQENGAFLLAPF